MRRREGLVALTTESRSRRQTEMLSAFRFLPSALCLLELRVSGRDNFLGCVVHGCCRNNPDIRIAKNAPAFFDIRAFKAGDDRDRNSEILCRGNDTVCDHVAADDTAENIYQ